MDSIRIEVDGLPPAKRSGKSMFAEQAAHHSRLLKLLDVAHQVKSAEGFRGFGQNPVCLDVELHAPDEPDTGDATNLLGGIADALEVKVERIRASGPLDHLGQRRYVGLYDNDRQIKEIRYRFMESDVARYVVTLTRLQ
jgi:hypothetical protein